MRRRWIITGFCLAALLALFLNWMANTPAAGLPAAVSSVAITILFALLGIRFIPLWMQDWSGAAEALDARASSERAVCIKIFIALLLTRVATIGLSYILDCAINGAGDFSDRMYLLWTSGDGRHYLDIAERWYQSAGSRDEVVRLVFLPLYPIAVRVFAYIFGDYFFSAMLISNLSFALAGTVLYRLARLDMEPRDALCAVKYLAILPSAFFFSAPMSDSLFLLLSVSCIYLARRKRYPASCFLGGLAAFTRSLGLTLLAPVCFELVSDLIREAKKRGGRRSLKYLPALLLIPCGFGLYLYINYRVSGNPFQYAVYQREHWSQSLGFFWNTASYQIQYAIASIKGGEPWKLAGLWLPNLVFLFGALIVMAAAVKKIRPAYTAYFIAYYIVAMGVTWLLSAPRYLASLFPLSLALSKLAEKRAVDSLLTAAFLLGTVLYLSAFAARWQVY